MGQRVNFLAVWVGDKYGPEYPAHLQNAVLRNCSTMEHDCAWFCITDRPDELPEGMTAIPADPSLPGWWAKLQLFSPGLPFEKGDRCVYFDLDVVITGRLEDLVETKGIIRDWWWPCFNSSVMVWDFGDHHDAWERFTPAEIDAPADPDIAPLLPAGQVNGGDQVFLTRVAADGEGWEAFPRDWCVSYRSAKSWPPDGCKVVVMHGSPKPHEVTEGWVPKTWAINGFTSLPVMRGVNTTRENILANIRTNCERDLPWFTGFGRQGRTAVLVCGGPSMKDCLPEIRDHYRRQARIVSVNNALQFLLDNKITPNAHVMLDARPENAAFVANAPAKTTYFLASQCHPDVFDALEGYRVVVWHNAFGDSGELREILDPWWESKPCILVPGGGTVGLRSLWLLAFSGYRSIHVYGMDSSFHDGKHHAYAQPLNDADAVMEVVMGSKTYTAARWMIRQAEEFKETWADLLAFRPYPGAPVEPVHLHVHGRGLIPDIAKNLRAQRRKAA